MRKKYVILLSLLFCLGMLKAQVPEITHLEYYFDVDPGFGNGNALDISQDSIINSVFEIDVNGLDNGFHRLYMRTKDEEGKWSLTYQHAFYKKSTQTISPVQKPVLVVAEYIIDEDPGLGNAISVPVSNNAFINESYTIDISGIDLGFHKLFFRTQDEGGNWSMAHKHEFYKKSSDSIAFQPTIALTDLEYYINDDPGFGNGNVLSFSADSLIDEDYTIDISELELGYHKLFVRSKDESDKWSTSFNHGFYKKTSDSIVKEHLVDIIEAEYYLDNDPGFGNGTDLALAIDSLVDENYTIDISELDLGYHKLFVRSKDESGKWSTSFNHGFYKKTSDSIVKEPLDDIIEAEYYLDNDPGFGNGTDLALVIDSLVDEYYAINISDLDLGYHKLFVRSKDESGKWSSSFNHGFYKKTSDSIVNEPLSDIVKTEYYLDNDPGFGNGIPLSFSFDSLINENYAVDISGLSLGYHKLFFRTLDQSGSWSLSKNHRFYKKTSQAIINSPLHDIVKCEYYFDVDPGLGNGTTIELSADSLIDKDFIADISALSKGYHKLNIRTMDETGLWSIANQHGFYKKTDAPIIQLPLKQIVYAEYFFNTDPGWGNGEVITFEPVSIIDISFDADMSLLSGIGENKIFTRVKDEDNHWSLIHAHTFTVNIIADFEASTTAAMPDETIHFTDLSSGNPTSWQWDFNSDDIIDSYDQNPEWSYTEPGLYSVSLTVSDGTNSNTEIKENYILVYGDLDADFSASPLIGVAPLEVQFTDESLGIPTNWEWDFDDNGFVNSTQQSPIWIFQNPGTYSVALKVSDGVNESVIIKENYITVLDAMDAEFSATPTYGEAELLVNFTDLSSGNPTSWQWDFNNDGLVESALQNPQWNYTDPGIYSVSLTISLGDEEDTETKTNYITVVEPSLVTPPVITNVADIPNDQGRQVQLIWNRASLDNVYSSDHNYSVWRHDDVFGDNAIALQNPNEIFRGSYNSEKIYYWNCDGEIWTYINFIPAIMQEEYGLVSPTLMDSTATGNNYSSFKVLFHTPTNFYASEPDSGYSIDNLAPFVPENVMGYSLTENTIHLDWSLPVDEDFQYFAIYRSNEDGMFGEEHYKTTVSNQIDGEISTIGYNYKITAFDFNGNESEESSIITSQSLILNEGWGGISGYVIPDYAAMESVFSSVTNDLVIVQNMEGYYWPGQNVNTLGDWDVNSGYYLKISDEATLPIVGKMISQNAVQLSEGWSLIPVISICEVEVDSVFAGTAVKLVKEVAGSNIFWPDYSINTLGTMIPGKAYFVLMDSEGEIAFPECVSFKGSTVSSIGTQSGQSVELLKEYNLNTTAITHTIAIPQSVAEIEPGNIIAAYDTNETCFGLTQWTAPNNSITLFGDDPLTVDKDGFMEGENISFKLINTETKEMVDFDVFWDLLLPFSDGLFHNHGLSAISELKMSSTSIGDNNVSDVIIYPNPARDKVNIKLSKASSACVSVYDISGHLLLSDSFEGKAKEVDFTSFESGIYLIEVKGKNIFKMDRLIKY